MGSGVLRQHDWDWLERIRRATDSPASIYPGERMDFVPSSVAHRLRTRRGALIEKFIPSNRVHRKRWTITREGRRALADHDPQEEADDGADGD